VIRSTSGVFVVVALASGVASVVPSSAWAVGLDGSGLVDQRATVGVGTGIDRVAGYGADAYPFAEVGGSYESVVWKRLVLGAAATFRQDLDDHSDVLGRWRHERSPAIAAQAWIGYDGPGFHVSVGPWLYGASRERPRFLATVLPYGVLRLRFGHQDAWHFNVHLGDGAPFTAEGGAFALRLTLGLPASGRHRMSGGLYTTVGENIAGLTFTDEIADGLAGGPVVGTRRRTFRWGGMVGTAYGDLSRVEVTGFVGCVW